MALDDLAEQRRPVLDGFGEDLEEVALVVAVDEDAQLADVVVALLDVADAVAQLGVVRLRHAQEAHAIVAQPAHRADDVAGEQGEVLDARTAVELEELVDLALLLARRWLVNGELDA